MLDVFLITTKERIHKVTGITCDLVDTKEEANVHVMFNSHFANADEYTHYLRQLPGETKAHLMPPSGLSIAWNNCMKIAKHDWVLLANDDIAVNTTFWEREIKNYIKGFPEVKCFFLCHPNGFSGFLLHKSLWESVGKFTPFPSGYYEDDDFFLKVMEYYNVHRKEEIMNSVFLSLYDSNYKPIFSHIPHAYKKTKGWDRGKNKEVFDTLWKQVNLGTDLAYENKNGLWYVRN